MNKIINFLQIYSFSQCMTSLTQMKIICSILTLWIYFLRNGRQWSQRPDLWSTYSSAFLDHLALVRSPRALHVCTDTITCVHGHHYLCARTSLSVCTDTIICIHERALNLILRIQTLHSIVNFKVFFWCAIEDPKDNIPESSTQTE